jgi:cellulose synthase/poly-beta-1,6-N-acetylglucosamine synthase-like glycosyltransferase
LVSQLREDLLLCSSYLPLGVPNGLLFTSHQALFLVPLPGRKKTSARGVSHTQSFILFLFCFILFLLASFYQKYKKISSFIVVTFTYLLFSLARMSNPEVEVHTFKQQGQRV